MILLDYTFHLTEKCNLNCKYCYEGEKGDKELSFDSIKTVLARESNSGNDRCCIAFFGGKPLLRKELIFDTVNYALELEKEHNIKFLYTITTNGTLIDKDFIKLAKKNDFLIGYSLDGNEETQNKNRVNYKGEGTFDIASDNAREVIKSVKRVMAMPVVTKNNYKDMTKNARYLFDMGFCYVNCAFDYTANWNTEDLPSLREEYEKLAELYYEKTKNNNDFYLLPFEDKIDTHIKGRNCEEKCQLGIKHVNVSASGKIYPCMQFVGNEKYEIGDTERGINEEKRKNLRHYAVEENPLCKDCKINKRCKHTCGCLNIMTSGDAGKTSGLVCKMERMFIDISDRLAEKLYKEGLSAFYTKKYCNW